MHSMGSGLVESAISELWTVVRILTSRRTEVSTAVPRDPAGPRFVDHRPAREGVGVAEEPEQFGTAAAAGVPGRGMRVRGGGHVPSILPVAGISA